MKTTLVGTIVVAPIALTYAFGAAGVGDSIPTAKMPEEKHVFSMSCKVTACNGGLSTAEGRAKAIAWWKKNNITKLWLESYRHGERVASERLAELRDAFRAEGFDVCGMITPTMLNDAEPGKKEPRMVVCWSDAKAHERMREECARAARLFDTVIIDDFLFSTCGDTCARCRADKAARGIADWGEYKRTLMYEVCEREILPAAKKANPNAHFIIKYPCWYKNYATNGYSPARQAELFGECWIGTETRDANPEPLQACWIAAWMDSITGGKCGGGWYDALDCTPEKFIEQARYTILGGMRESLVHCYDYLLADDPGRTPFGEKAKSPRFCAEAFEREIGNLVALAERVRGAVRGKFEMLPCNVSRHEFRKDGTAFTVYLNTKDETVHVPATDIVLAPHELRTIDAAAIGCTAAASVTIHSATTNGVEVRWFEEMVPMKDGVRLYTYGALPPEGETSGIVFRRNPYVQEKPVDMAAYALSRRNTLKRGYAYVEQHVRGTGMSEGAWVPYESEREDGLAMLDWLRRLPHYGGEIFLSGGSYLSSVHFSYLDTNPPDVKGSALFVQDVNRYNVAYRNGFFKIGLHGGWFVKGYRKKDKSLSRNGGVTFADFPLAAFSRRYWGEAVPALDNVLRHPRPDDPFWRSCEPGSGADYLNAISSSTMPILLRTAFYDIYTDGVCEMWRGMTAKRRSNCALIIDAYNHRGQAEKWAKGTLGEFPGGSRAYTDVSDLDWFDYCRTGKPVANAQPGKTRYFALWENAWKEEPELVDGEGKVRLALGAGARTWVYDPKRPLPQFPGSGGIAFGGMQLQPPPNFRDDVVSFVLPPIEERLDVRGRMTAELAVASDCEDTCFYVRVSVDKGDGKWYLLRDDITSLSFAGGPYNPGEERKVSFRFADHAFRLEKGDVLRVDVSSANSQFAPHPNVIGDAFACSSPKVAHNTVYPERSFIQLPALGLRRCSTERSPAGAR